MHLTTYVNAVDPVAEVFDAYLLQGRSGSGVPLAGWDLRNFDANDTESRRSRLRGRDHIRADGRVPVLIVQSETDVFGALSYLRGAPGRQRALPIVGGRRRGALRHVLPVCRAL